MIRHNGRILRAALVCDAAEAKLVHGVRMFSGNAVLPSVERGAVEDGQGGVVYAGACGMPERFFEIGDRYILTLAPESEADKIERKSNNGLAMLGDRVFERVMVQLSDRRAVLHPELAGLVRNAIQDALQDEVAERVNR